MAEKFVQIIEYETDRFDELSTMMDDMSADAEAAGRTPPFSYFSATRDRDNPNRYLTIIEFASYDEAMENSNRPETSEMARKFAALCTKGPIYHNLDVLRSSP
jgi:hypothetical protein